MKHFTFIKSLLAVLLIAGYGLSGLGQIPESFSFQIFITDNSGTPIPDGTYNVSLSFYTTPSGGLPALDLDQETINVSGGLANIVLGGQASLNLPVHLPLYVGLSIGNGDEMTPRMPVIPSLQSHASRGVFGDLNLVPPEGNVGFGTLNPTAQLEVEGDAKFNGQVSIEDLPVIDDLELAGVQIHVVTPSGSNTLKKIPSDDFYEYFLKPNIAENDINLFDSSGEEVFLVNANDGSSFQKGFGIFESGFRAGLPDSHFYANNDGGFGINFNSDTVVSFKPTGLGTIGGGLRIGHGTSYANFSQTGRVDLIGDNGTAVTFDPNGSNSFYNPTTVRNDFFVSSYVGDSAAYFASLGDGSFGNVINEEWKILFNPSGNSVINTPLFLNPGMVIGSAGNSYTTFYNDGIIFRDTTDDITMQFLADGSISAINLNVTGEKNFKIDHPLDPEHKYLLHRSIESSDRLNLYNGNVKLNNNGEAEVDLPEWFGELNEDYRYQLTAIGAPGPNLYISQKIKNNKFKISGGTADMEVSWQVTGKRKDKYANNEPALVEVLKESPELSAKIEK